MNQNSLIALEQTIQGYGVHSELLESELTRQQIHQYCLMLWERNQHLNLTRHTDWATFVCRDLVDTLALSHWIGVGQQVLDIGTGGGVPGLLMTILRPDLDISLSESVGKRARVLAEFAENLGVPVRIYQTRGENLLDEIKFDAVTARAVGPLKKICQWLQGRWMRAGRVLAIKGPNWPNEQQVAKDSNLLKGVELTVLQEYINPGMESKSVILELTAKSAPRNTWKKN